MLDYLVFSAVILGFGGPIFVTGLNIRRRGARDNRTYPNLVGFPHSIDADWVCTCC